MHTALRSDVGLVQIGALSEARYPQPAKPGNFPPGDLGHDAGSMSVVSNRVAA
jgi:hypothetical protein